MNHKQVATDVLTAVGGKENVISVIHCMTRLRFKLKDATIPNKEEVEKIEGVISVVEKGGQYQVVIGNQVSNVFKEVIKITGEQTEVVDENGEKGSLFDQFTSMISNIFAPVLGVMAGTGILKGILSICIVSGILASDSGTYKILYSISDTLIYFFPIFLGASAAKYFKMNQYLGMAIGAAMLYPTIIEMASSGEALNFLGLPMNLINYSSSVFPVIVAVWLGSKLEKALDKVTPQGFKFFFVPLGVLVTILPLTYFLVGPALTFVSKLLSNGTMAVYNFNPILGGIALGGPWILIVMFGLHWAFIPVFINNMVTMGSDSSLALLTANQFAMAGATVAIALKTRDMKLKNLSWSTGGTCLLGISEPTLYGILLPMKKPLIMAIIGGSLGGAVAGVFNSKIYSFGGSGLLQIPAGINPNGIDAGFYGFVASMVVGFVVGFILTYLWGYSNKVNLNSGEASTPAKM